MKTPQVPAMAGMTPLGLPKKPLNPFTPPSESLIDRVKTIKEQRDVAVRACQAALAYLADQPSKFATNRRAAEEILRSAVKFASQ